jgi:hypothetical protein
MKRTLLNICGAFKKGRLTPGSKYACGLGCLDDFRFLLDITVALLPGKWKFRDITHGIMSDINCHRLEEWHSTSKS